MIFPRSSDRTLSYRGIRHKAQFTINRLQHTVLESVRADVLYIDIGNNSIDNILLAKE
ncbi:MAG: hypothetical protein F6K11_31025 [Leptolyngbya sp. SIO3F4]|nr:hypothetical protein [Leptolyngbya sp. SIO3F4]